MSYCLIHASEELENKFEVTFYDKESEFESAFVQKAQAYAKAEGDHAPTYISAHTRCGAAFYVGHYGKGILLYGFEMGVRSQMVRINVSCSYYGNEYIGSAEYILKKLVDCTVDLSRFGGIEIRKDYGDVISYRFELSTVFAYFGREE